MNLLNNFLYSILKRKGISLFLVRLFYGISLFVSLILVLYGIFTLDFRQIFSFSNLLPFLLLFFGLNLSYKQIKRIISIDESVLNSIKKFIDKNCNRIFLTVIFFIVTLVLLQLRIKFVTVAFALPIVFLSNLTFILEIFMEHKLKIGFFTFTLDLALYYVQVLYLFVISGLILRIFKKSKS